MAGTSLEIGQNRRVTTFKERIKADISEAMKARDELRLSTLRMVLSAIHRVTNSEPALVEILNITKISIFKSFKFTFSQKFVK
jgi:hypothetical protein